MRTQVSVGTITVLLLLLVAGCGKREEVVATVGKEKITVSEFKTSFISRFRGEENAMKQSFADREKMVREMAIILGKYQEGLSRGYDKRPALAEEFKAMTRRKALDLLYGEKVVKVVLTEAAIREFYDKSGEELRGRHILLKFTPQDTTQADTQRVKTRIDSIRTAISKGLDFKTAAKLFSEDGTTAADSGDLGWFGWGRMVEEFQRAAWAAKLNEVVGPVATQYGFHLLKIEERRPVPDRRPYDEVKDQIRERLREAQAAKMMDVAQKYVLSLHDKYDLKYNEPNLDMFRSRLLDPTVSKNQPLGPMFTEDQRKSVVATYRGGKVTVDSLINKIGNNAERVDWKDKTAATDLVRSIVEPILLEKEAEKAGLIKKAEQDPELQTQRRQAIVRELEKEEVTDKINPTEEEERNYYQAHLSNYIQPEMRTVREIFIKEDSVKAARVWQRAAKGEDFKKLALRFNEKESTKPDTGRIGPFEQKRFGLIGTTAFMLEKVGAISKPVAVGKNWSVVQLLEIIPSRTKTFEEASAQVKREYRQYKTDELQQALEQRMLEKYKPKVNTRVLANVWPLPEQGKK